MNQNSGDGMLLALRGEEAGKIWHSAPSLSKCNHLFMMSLIMLQFRKRFERFTYLQQALKKKLLEVFVAQIV